MGSYQWGCSTVRGRKFSFCCPMHARYWACRLQLHRQHMSHPPCSTKIWDNSIFNFGDNSSVWKSHWSPPYPEAEVAWIKFYYTVHSHILVLEPAGCSCIGNICHNGVFCMLSSGALARWCMDPVSLKYTFRKKKLSNFLRSFLHSVR